MFQKLFLFLFIIVFIKNVNSQCMCTGWPGTFCGTRTNEQSDFPYLKGNCSKSFIYYCPLNNPNNEAEDLSTCPEKKCKQNPYSEGGRDECLF